MASKIIHPHECRVCRSAFKHGGPEPYLLPCLHSVCGTCLGADRTEDLTCSKCMETFSKRDSEFPRDAVTVKDTFLSSVKENPGKVLCTNREDGNQAKSWCQECEAFLCGICLEYHKVVKISRDHVVKPLSTCVEAGGGQSDTVYCQVHEHHPLELFDESCSQLLCYKCLNKEHDSCDVQDISTTYEHVKEVQLKEGMENLTEKLQSISEVESQIHDLESRLNRQMTNIRETVETTFSDLRNTLNQREDEVLHQLELCFKGVRDNNAERLVNLAQARTRCQIALEFNKKCHEISSHIDLLRMASAVDTKTTSCTEEDLPEVRTEESDIVFSHADVEDLKDFISSFGEYYTPTTYFTPVKGRIASLTASKDECTEKLQSLETQLSVCTAKLENIANTIDGNRSSGTLKVVFPREDTRKQMKCGKSVTVKNIPWYICLDVRSTRDMVDIYLCCNDTPPGKGSCEVEVELVCPWTPGKSNYTCRGKGFLGRLRSLSVMELVDWKARYLRNGAITVQANIDVKEVTGMWTFENLLRSECCEREQHLDDYPVSGDTFVGGTVPLQAPAVSPWLESKSPAFASGRQQAISQGRTVPLAAKLGYNVVP